MRVEKEAIRCYVNDQLVIESTDHGLTGGKAGLAKFRDTKAMFREFRLGANLPPSGPTPSEAEIAVLAKQIEELNGKPEAEAIGALQTHAELSRAMLAEKAGKLEVEAARLRKLAVNVHRQSVQNELVQLFQAPEEKIDLFHATLLVSKLDNADLDVQAYRAQLEEMARDLAAELPKKPTDETRLSALLKYLFTENGFHGSRSDYYNRANSYVNQVLDDREGLPITLSVLFLELARRIGLDHVAGVSLPGHFIVKHTSQKGHDQLIDVFDAGKTLSRAEAGEMVLNFTGAPLRDEHLLAASKRDIIIRMLQNLLRVAQQSESTAASLHYLDVIVALAPDAAFDRYSRALLRLRSGDSVGAKQDLKWILDNQPAGIDLEKLTELYQSF